VIKRIWKILQKFGFKKVTQSERRRRSNSSIDKDTSDLVTVGEKDKDNEGNYSIDNDIDGRKGSVCITYDDDDKVRRKIKLHWDDEDGKLILTL